MDNQGMMMRNRHKVLVVAVAWGLASCGGGGGGSGDNVRPTPPPEEPTQLPVLINPLRQVAVVQAQAKGLTGAGVKVGIVDVGINPDHPSVQGRVVWFPYGSTSVADDPPLGLNPPESFIHGTNVATVLAGRPTGLFTGGVAPDAVIGVARYSSVPMPQRLADWGARVLNYSFGDTLHLDTATREDYLKYYPSDPASLAYVRDKGTVVVASAGNQAHSSPSVMSGARYFYPELTNTLVVVAVDPDTHMLASYSNQCGERAQMWCVAAPGTMTVPRGQLTTAPNTANNYAQFTGTSVAAPIVSGVVALVAQAFPWMTSTQLADTVLSTTTDLGASGVDTVYGRGLVNAERAVQGPAQVNGTFSAAVPAGVSAHFNNPISGSGNISLVGNGTLRLGGENTYSGTTQVYSGVLDVAGSLAGGVELQGGTLTGGGHIKGSVVGQGVIEGVMGQTLTVEGTVDSSQQSLRVVRFGDAPYATQDTGVVLQAGAGVANLAVDSGSAWFDVHAQHSDNSIVATLLRRNVRDVVQSRHASAAANAARVEMAFDALDNNAASAVLRASAGDLQHTSGAEADMALASLDGQGLATAQALMVDVGASLDGLVDQRVRDVQRSGGAGAWWAVARPESRLSTPGWFPMTTRSTVWMAGVDTTMENTAVAVGAGVFSAENRGNVGGYGTVASERTGVMVYGQHHSDRQWMQARMHVADINQRSNRTLWTGRRASWVRGTQNATSFGAALTWGHALDTDNTLNMSVGVQYEWARVQRGREWGNTGFELLRTPDTLRRGDMVAEIRYAPRLLHTHWSWDGAIGLRHTFDRPDLAFGAAFAGAPDMTFVVNGMPWDSTAVRWDMGVWYQPRNTMWWLRANGEHSTHRNNTTLAAGMRWTW